MQNRFIHYMSSRTFFVTVVKVHKMEKGMCHTKNHEMRLPS